jgi:hypothetical protein
LLRAIQGKEWEKTMQNGRATYCTLVRFVSIGTTLRVKLLFVGDKTDIVQAPHFAELANEDFTRKNVFQYPLVIWSTLW